MRKRLRNVMESGAHVDARKGKWRRVEEEAYSEEEKED